MTRFKDLPETIPVFPLPGALLLPRGRLPLHIFEPRYLAMVDECLKTPHRLIGMIQPRSGQKAEEPLQAIGCAGRLTQFAETEDQRYMITLTGVSRFRIVQELDGFTPWRRMRVEWESFPQDTGAAETDEAFDRATFLPLLQRYFTARGLATEWDALESAGAEMLINGLSMLCPFAPEEKQALLEAPTLRDRRETLTTMIEIALHSGNTSEEPRQ